MTEDRGWQPDSHSCKCLALGFVDGGGKSGADWKLASRPLKGVICGISNELDARDQDFLLSDSCAHQQFVVEDSLEKQFGAIAQSLFGADVAE